MQTTRRHPLLDPYFRRPFVEYVPLTLGDLDAMPDEIVGVHFLRYMLPGDIPSCTKIVLDNWGFEHVARYERQMMAAFREGGITFFVTECGGKITGFAGMRESWSMFKAWDFIGINVAKESRSKGVGRILTEARIDLVRAFGGDYISLSTIRPGFFEQFGFEPIDVQEGWVVMRRRVDPNERPCRDY